MNSRLTQILQLFIVCTLVIAGCTEDDDSTEPVVLLDNLTIDITGLKTESSYGPNDTIQLQAMIIGELEQDYSKLNYSWTSDKDGVLNEGSVGEDGISTLQAIGLTKNIHEITFEVKNSADSTISKSITCNSSFWLYPPLNENNMSTLTWGKLNVFGFESYNLYRSGGNSFSKSQAELLFTSEKITDTVFVDSTATLGDKYHYQLYANVTNNTYLKSNVEDGFMGDFISLDVPIYKVTGAANSDYFYGIVGPESLSDEDEGEDNYGVMLFDKSKLAVINRILNNKRYRDLEIWDGKLYLSGTSYNIDVVDISTFELERSIPTSKRVREISIGSNNRLYYREEASVYSNTSTPLVIIDLSTDEEVYTSSSTFYRGDFDIDHDNNQIIHVDGLSSTSIILYSTEDDSFAKIREVGGPSHARYLNKRGPYVFCDHLLFNASLTEQLGQFSADNFEKYIFHASPSGSYSISYGTIFNTSTQTVKKTIPSNFDNAFFTDENEILLIDNAYDEESSIIIVYNF